jgi:serralysin
MFPSRFATAASAGCIIAGLAVPATAGAQPSSDTIVDIVIQVSGPEGFDDNRADYDLLRDALVATGLAEAVATSQDITVFAPTDAAFLALAIDLGFTGTDESGAFGYIAELTGFVSADEPGLLDDVLLYHVSPGAKTVRQLRHQHPVTTLLPDATLEVRGNRVIDGDTNDRDGRISRPRNLRASNGIIQTVDGVLRPLDLEPPAPEVPETVVDVVLEASGSEGFDSNYFDYDLLREALVAAGLVDALATAEDITVFAPNDFAFIVLALDLGYGAVDEAGAFAFIAEATGYVSPDDPGLLDDVLLYHVLPGAKTLNELEGAGDQATLLTDATLSVRYRQIHDGDPDDVNGVIVHPNDVAAGNGIVHTTAFVLRPIDL